MILVGLLLGSEPGISAELERRAGVSLYEERLVQVGGSGESIGRPLLGMEIGFLWRFAEIWRAGFTVQGALLGRDSIGLVVGVVPRGFDLSGPMVDTRLSMVATGLNCAPADGCPYTFGAMMVDARGGMLEIKPGWRFALGDDLWGVSLGLAGHAAWLNTAVPKANGPYLGGLLGFWVTVDL